MTIDPSNPAHAHRNAVTCALVRDCPHASKHDRHLKPAGPSPHRVAVEALHDSALSASLLRALLEGCGVRTWRYDDKPTDYPCVYVGVHDEDGVMVDAYLDESTHVSIGAGRAPAIIAALLACADAAGALAALREAGR